MEAQLACCAKKTASKCMATHPTLNNWPHVELRGLSTSKTWALFEPKLRELWNQPDRTMTAILYIVDNQWGSHISTEVMVGICSEPEVAIHQGHKGQGFLMRSEL